MLIGLTGGIGSGKSTVADLFGELGAVVIKADDLAREVIAEGGRAHAAVLAHFGTDIVDVAGKIDRQKLAELVFNNPEELRTLEQITHPAVQAELRARLDSQPDDAIVIYEIPLLIEKNLFNKFDKTIAVLADLDLRKSRAINRGVLEADFLARVENQTDDETREKSVDFVIRNNGELGELRSQVKDIFEKLNHG